MDNRDMFYNSYGYSSGYPNQMFQPNMANMMFPNQSNQFNDLENRLNRMERQINRLNQRVTRLETPNNTYNEPDNNLYML